MKNIIIILFSAFIAAVSIKANAQVRLDPFYPYSKYTFGIGIGYTHLYGDWTNSNSQQAYKINVARNINEWVNVNIELQKGSLNEYESKNHWTNGLSVNNDFTGGALIANMSIGELFNWPKSFLVKQFYGIYIGTGIGYMHNNIANITLKFRNADKYLITDYDPGNINMKSNCFYLPLNVGIDLHITKIVVLNVNYQMNYAFSDYVDGYNFKPPIATNNYNDLYSVLSFGLHFYIGEISMTPNKK